MKKHILSVKTQFQHVEIIDTYEYGRMVILDNQIQSAEADEFIYHEVLVHPAMIAHPEPESILILGAGEGATLREVLKHTTVKKVIMIDIDREFVNLCMKYLRKWHQGSFGDPRVKLIYGDAFKYLKKIRDRFDVIITDINDPVGTGPAVSMYTKKFYSLIKKTLMPGGIFVTHATSVYYVPRKNISTRIYKTLSEIFPEVDFYYEYIPSFGALWAFITASTRYSPKKIASNMLKKRIEERKLNPLLFYDADIHKRLFGMPVCMRKTLSTG